MRQLTITIVNLLWASTAVRAFPNQTTGTSICGSPTCTIYIAPSTLTYPFPINVATVTSTAIVVPIVYSYDGQAITTSSTYAVYNTVTNESFTAPPSSSLVWTTYGTVLTYPTKYIGYVSVSLRTFDSTCARTQFSIAVPSDSSSRLVFPLPSPASSSAYSSNAAFSVIQTLPAITTAVQNPISCASQILSSAVAPSSARSFTPAPAVIYTTVSVLTRVNPTQTVFGNPFSGQQDVTPAPSLEPPHPTVVTNTVVQTTKIVTNGQTIVQTTTNTQVTTITSGSGNGGSGSGSGGGSSGGGSDGSGGSSVGSGSGSSGGSVGSGTNSGNTGGNLGTSEGITLNLKDTSSLLLTCQAVIYFLFPFILASL